jgi:hypothetical protein
MYSPVGKRRRLTVHTVFLHRDSITEKHDVAFFTSISTILWEAVLSYGHEDAGFI